MSANLSILGLRTARPNLFDAMRMPDGVDAGRLADYITVECAELEMVYTDADFLHDYLAIWSAVQLPTWQRVARLASTTYEPYENYDRYSSYTDTASNSSSSSSESDGSGHDETDGSTGRDATTTGKVAAFNSSEMEPRDESVLDEDDSSHAESDSTSHAESTNHGSSSGTLSHSEHTHGNIGVTTAQQMGEQELAYAPKINIYDYITTDFKRHFCLLVY